MDHLEAIVELKGIINNNFIQKIISLIDKKAKKKLAIRGGNIDTEIRNVKGYHLNFDTPTNLFYWNFIKQEIERVYNHYKIKFPKMASKKVNQIDLLKYTSGNKYEIHTDHFTNSPRHLSIIINLNDNYEGGDLIFFDQKNFEVKRLNLTKGSIVFFPSNFMYPHSIDSITKGTRYSIVAWLE
tara:strand:- start:1117 stop:1665 length:549 start_codon:yes stop_codon:yes gene_type:complete